MWDWLHLCLIEFNVMICFDVRWVSFLLEFLLRGPFRFPLRSLVKAMKTPWGVFTVVGGGKK